MTPSIGADTPLKNPGICKGKESANSNELILLTPSILIVCLIVPIKEEFVVVCIRTYTQGNLRIFSFQIKLTFIVSTGCPKTVPSIFAIEE